MVAAALIGAAVIGAAGSAYSANKQSKAAKDAANAAAKTGQEQLGLFREQRDLANQILTPYSLEGYDARRLLNASVGLATQAPGGIAGAPAGTTTPEQIAAARAQYDQQFEQSPYWQDAQYSTNRGFNALMSTNAALGRGGSINSGKALRGASDIAQGYRAGARGQFENALLGTAGTGFTADTGRASAGQTYATQASQALGNTTALTNQYNLARAGAQAQGAQNIAQIAGYGLNALAYGGGGGTGLTATAPSGYYQPLPQTGGYTPLAGGW